MENHNSFQSLQSDQIGFSLLSNHLRDRAGISLPMSHKNLCLMASRLSKLMREYNLETYRELYQCIRERGGAIESDFIMALTTNTTQFFRENSHFRELTQVLPDLAKLDFKDSEVRLWCAAASTGQEPYSLAMTCQEYADLNVDFNFRILATDIDLKVLNKAASGVYNSPEVNNIDALRLKKYFETTNVENKKFFRVRKTIADSVHFSPFNLLSKHYSFKKNFHVIFVRNVFIYFDKETIDFIVDQMADALYQGGYLFLGHSESGVMRNKRFKAVSHSVFQKL